MDEATSNQDTTLSLLERLRQKLIVVNPTTEEEEREKVKLIVEHKSEFPSKLRPAITSTSTLYNIEPDAEAFLATLNLALTRFFSCESVETGGPALFVPPQSLNDEIDTAEEVELLLRCFPNVLTTELFMFKVEGRVGGDLHGYLVSLNCFPNPVSTLLIQEKAISFVPLFVELGIEIGGFEERQRGGLACESFLTQLFYSKFEQALPILVQLREKGLVGKQEECDLVSSLLSAENDGKPLDFIETRLRILVQWNPAILMNCDNCTYLLHFYRFTDRNKDQRIHQAIIELGTTHYPEHLGFVFHKMINQDLTYFAVSCSFRQTEWMKRMVCDVILRSVQRNTLRDYILAAATNDEISLDGLYTLIRYDPIALIGR
eukprot:CAMPEP_0116101778 /NCGR_PEP_ID=MMETSP0327-20121206/12988_1 /TAXON_ID=44447 /ORGANISM="Pseudo-nitzschia delicatissima, Strain B596" /LENGTH=374 /DNA_ID=CAMNT_0003593755 /DNA_START=249 /DNA_END=1373 /DNA_ORIENTATION=+